MRLLRINIVLLPMLLAACGGGGGSAAGVSPLLDVGAARTLTGSTAPAETPADQRARAFSISPRFDTIAVSLVDVETNNPQFAGIGATPRCSRRQCVVDLGPRIQPFTVGLEDIEVPRENAVAILTKYSITVMLENTGDTVSHYAWMDHAVFGMEGDRSLEDGLSIDIRYGGASGELTGTRPNGITGTWRGLMLGTPRRGAMRGNILQGDATLTYTDGTSSTIDAAFTNIRDLSQGASHSTTSVRFDNIPVSADGTYRSLVSSTRDNIEGSFYGPQHAETAGIFVQNNIIGAFGAKRQ